MFCITIYNFNQNKNQLNDGNEIFALAEETIEQDKVLEKSDTYQYIESTRTELGLKTMLEFFEQTGTDINDVEVILGSN